MDILTQPPYRKRMRNRLCVCVFLFSVCVMLLIGIPVCVFSYVERKNFLERVDQRQFEQEKKVRLGNMKR